MNQNIDKAWINYLLIMAYWIATMEGYFKPGSIAARQNNPGNLRSWGSNPVRNGFAAFPDPAAGWRALYSQVSLNTARGLSMYEFFGGKAGVYPGYAPASDNNRPREYARYISDKLPQNRPDMPLDAYFWSNVDNLARLS